MDRTFRKIAHRLRPYCRPIGVVIGLSLAAGAALAAGQEAEMATAGSRTTLEAAVVDDRLRLRAEGAPLAEVLRAIGAAGVFDVVLRGELDEPVDRSFTDEPLEDAIRDLVGAHFLVVVHGDRTPDQAGTSLAGIRVTAKRRHGSLDPDDKASRAEGPAATSEDDATDPIDRQEAHRRAVPDDGPPTRDNLLSELDRPDPAARAVAIAKVGTLPPRAAIEVISHVFANDDDTTVRSRAVTALTRLEGPGARGLLRERALEDDDPGLRMRALNALASSRGERSLNILVQTLRQDPEPEVRMSALRALRRLGGDWAQRALARAARDPDPTIGRAAEQALSAWADD